MLTNGTEHEITMDEAERPSMPVLGEGGGI